MKRPLNKNGSALFLVAFLLALFANAQAQQPAMDPLLDWLDRIAQKYLQWREQAIAEIRTVADPEKRKQWVRAKVLEWRRSETGIVTVTSASGTMRWSKNL